MTGKIYKSFYASCITCGHTTEGPVEVIDGLPKSSVVKCPKCSNQATLGNIRGLFEFQAMVAKEISKLKMQIFDLECQIEELVEGHQGER
jgi:DNA-directed RNA polymerase subunit RPC12/RpoP